MSNQFKATWYTTRNAIEDCLMIWYQTMPKPATFTFGRHGVLIRYFG